MHAIAVILILANIAVAISASFDPQSLCIIQYETRKIANSTFPYSLLSDSWLEVATKYVEYYAGLHGYRYFFNTTKAFGDDYLDCWGKLPAVLDLYLKEPTCEIVVYMDSG